MKVLLTLGLPDDANLRALLPRSQAHRLIGNSGLTEALIPHLRRLDWAHEIRILGRSGPLKPSSAQVIVNLVGDASVHRQSLQRLDLWADSGMPIVNPSPVVRACSREQLPQSLAGVTDITVPNTSLYSGDGALELHIEQHAHHYPVLIRTPGTHGSHSLLRIEGPAQLPDAAQRWFITDFHDTRSADGLYRKRRMIAIGEQLFCRHQLAAPDWNLRGQARHHMFAHPALIEEERAFMSAPPSGPAERGVARAFARLDVDFAVCDYALDAHGKAVIFELNPCFQLTGSMPERSRYDWRYLEASNPAILDALTTLVSARAAR